MIGLLSILGWTCFTVYVALAIVSLFSFISEKEWRAVSGGVLLFLPMLTAFGIILSFEFYLRPLIITAILLINLIIILLILLPISKTQSIRIVEQSKRVDERDALFHRFYRLKPGTSEFETYYQNHPEKREIDENIRALPALGSPGSKSYHPLGSPYHEAIFSVLGKSVRDIEWEPETVEGKPVHVSPVEMTRRLKDFAHYLGADLAGTTLLNPAYIYSHIARGSGEWGAPIELNHKYAIVIAVEMQHDMIRHAPESPTITESAFSYYENAKIAMIIAKYINLLGYEARAHVDSNYRVMCIPIAVDAGLGELGRLGLLITSMPLLQDQPISFGVQHFCTICKKCAINCPSASIDMEEKRIHNGVEKWLSDQDSCYRFWRVQGTDCAVCVKVCPYSYPNTRMHNLVRWIVRRNNFARKIAFTGDQFFYGRRPKNHSRFPGWHYLDENYEI